MSPAELAASPASLFATIAIAHGLAVASPGPDLAVVTRQTLAHGRRAGIVTALGIACGIGFHVAYGMFGLAWAIERHPALLGGLRFIGALLLLWIAWGALRSQPLPETTIGADTGSAASRDFAIGLATNLLNVKAMLFFIALCSAVITASTPTWLKLGLSAWMIVATGAWFCVVAWTLGHPALRSRLRRNAHLIDRAMGAILLALGTAMLLSLVSG